MYFFVFFIHGQDPRQGEAIPLWKEIHMRGIAGACLMKFGRLGVDAFADHAVAWTVLLYCTIRQGDTNPVARAYALMQHFGSLHAVLEATAWSEPKCCIRAWATGLVSPCRMV